MAITRSWSRSTYTAKTLLSYITSGVILAKGKLTRWRIPGKVTEPAPEHNEFVVFTSFLDRGLAFPTSQFLRQLLAFYGIKFSDLGPHSLQQISFFIALCEGYLGCPAYFPLWLTIFHGRAARVSEEDGGQLLDSGGITFQVQGGEGFISAALPGKAASN
jgi:hypothetical protein